MHFAMPPRKTSRPPPYAARQSGSSIPHILSSLLRRDRLRLGAIIAVVMIILMWLTGSIGSGRTSGTPLMNITPAAIGTGAPVVIITVIDPAADAAWTQKIKQNREDYARRHGYLTFFPTNTDYPLGGAPTSWAKVPAMRHAMTAHPTSTWFWNLDSNALIMNPSIPLAAHALTPARLEKLMVVNEPVVPPDSVIKTFASLRGDRIDLVVTQDREGLSQHSYVVRNGEWAKYFLDAWFDPIYRTYNFQKAETHALEHIVQWHGTLLAKLALVPQNIINAYASGPANSKHGQYRDGDLVANFAACERDGKSCADEMRPFLDKLEAAAA